MPLIYLCFVFWLLWDEYKNNKISKELAELKSELMKGSDNNAE